MEKINTPDEINISSQETLVLSKKPWLRLIVPNHCYKQLKPEFEILACEGSKNRYKFYILSLKCNILPSHLKKLLKWSTVVFNT